MDLSTFLPHFMMLHDKLRSVLQHFAEQAHGQTAELISEVRNIANQNEKLRTDLQHLVEKTQQQTEALQAFGNGEAFKKGITEALTRILESITQSATALGSSANDLQSISESAVDLPAITAQTKDIQVALGQEMSKLATLYASISIGGEEAKKAINNLVLFVNKYAEATQLVQEADKMLQKAAKKHSSAFGKYEPSKQQ